MQHMMDFGDDADEEAKSETNLDKLEQIMNMSDEPESIAAEFSANAVESKKNILRKPGRSLKKIPK